LIFLLFCRFLKVNPDNVATPIAASLGDVTTLSLLAWIADRLHRDMEAQQLTAPFLIGIAMSIFFIFLKKIRGSS
jgi:solute carrier family 41